MMEQLLHSKEFNEVFHFIFSNLPNFAMSIIFMLVVFVGIEKILHGVASIIAAAFGNQAVRNTK
jgi:hypothetical protein